MPTTTTFAERLAQERREKAARDRKDIGQKDVAAAIGSSAPSVSRWESGIGMPEDGMIQKLAAYFGVNPGWLHYGFGPRHVDGDVPALPDPTKDRKLTEEELARASRQAEIERRELSAKAEKKRPAGRKRG